MIRRRMILRTPVRSTARVTPLLLAPVIALVLVLVGCRSQESSMPGVAVTISGEPLPYTDFESYLTRQLGPERSGLDDVGLSSLFDQYLDGQLLSRLAVERGLVEGEVDERRAMAFLLQGVRYEPSEAEMRAYFTAHRKDFERPELVHLRVILTHEAEAAEQALEALKEQDFAEVAARFSQGPTAHLGGEQGWLSRDDLDDLFGEVIFKLEVDEISRIVEADFGFQIFQITERRASNVMPFEDAEPQIREKLNARHLDEQLAAALEEARGRYNVRVLGGNLPFTYRGAYSKSPASA